MGGFRWNGRLGAMDIRASVSRPSFSVRGLSLARMDERWARSYQTKLRHRNLVVRNLRAHLTPRQAMSMRGAAGISDAEFGSLLDDVLAAREELENLTEIPPSDIVESFQSMYADGIGQALGGLGMPVDAGAVIRGCAREFTRRQFGEESGVLTYAQANAEWLYDQIGDYGETAASYFGEMRVAASRFLGGNAGQVVNIGQRLADWWTTTGGDQELSLIRANIESVSSGIRGVIDHAAAAATDWITDDMRTAAGGVLRAIQAGASSRTAAGMISAVGGGISSIAPLLGPAAPFVSAAGAVVSAGSMVASLFESLLYDPPPARAALRPYAEHWAVLKLYLSAMDSEYDDASIETLKTTGWSVKCDPVTGETLAKPPGRWASPIRGWTTTWNAHIRVIDLFERTSLINDRLYRWINEGRGIAFDGSESSPCRTYDMVPVSETFVRFVGAETFSPAARNADSNWPVGPTVDYASNYWNSRQYRAAVFAAALIGGCPPYASYGSDVRGSWTTPDASYSDRLPGSDAVACDRFRRRGDNGYNLLPHCLGIGGNRVFRGDDARVGEEWIPWACTVPSWDAKHIGPPCNQQSRPFGDVALIAPRMVPKTLTGYGYPASRRDPKYGWASAGFIPGDDPGTDNTVYGNGSEKKLWSVRTWLDDCLPRPYDQNDPRTWFPRETRSRSASISSSISARSFTPMSVARARVQATGGPSVPLVVGGLGLVGLAAWLILK